MKNIHFFLLVFLPFLSNGQTVFSLQDKDSNEPVPYATIWKDNQMIASSDTDGTFIINTVDKKPVYRITSINYKTLDDISLEERIIALEKKVIPLKEVVVRKKTNAKAVKLGKLSNEDTHIVASKDYGDPRAAKYFKNYDKKQLYLDKLRLKTRCEHKNMIGGISIYSVGKDGEPDKLINTENIIHKFKKGYNTNEIDLSHLDILMPDEGIFIVFEYIYLMQNRSYDHSKKFYIYEPRLPIKYTNEYVDSWYSDNGIWKKVNYSLCFQLILKE
ncbi:hypothetical protein CMT45_00060 [Elizabethkingia anophelis]|nr:hypothetical protein [Elizabethkingia anophelis]